MPDVSISAINPLEGNAFHFRRLQKFGMHVADMLGTSTTVLYPGFGSGNDYTVANWISSGAFPNLAAVQAAFPIVQATTDYVDWVLIQSAIDAAIYGSLGSSARANTKRIVRIPAGNYKINRTLHIGYGTLGTPPAALNGNGYVSVTIEGEGPHYDPSGNGMTGTTITTTDTSFIGVAVTRGVDVIFRDWTLQGAYDSFMASSNPYRTTNGWDIQAYRRTAPAVADANWIDGSALNVGVCLSPYTESGSAAAYPARVLPSFFGGGTSTAQTGSVGGSGLLMEKFNIRGFIVGLGRPYGDQNDEFISFHGGTIQNCVIGVVTRHSQNRNMSFRDCKMENLYCAFANRGGPNLSGNSNMHGTYDNIHFGRCYKLFSHSNGDWSGPIVLKSCYAESFISIGEVGGRSLKLVDGFFSFIEQENTDGVPPYHFRGTKLIVDHTILGITRHGFITGSFSFNDPTQVILINGSVMDSHATTRNNPAGSTFNGHPNLDQIRSGFHYMRGLFALPGLGSQIINDRDVGEYGPNLVDTNRTDEVIDTHIQQQWTQFYSQYPRVSGLLGSNEMQGSVQSFRVPKITAWQFGGLNVTARNGLDLTCSRVSFGDIKMDVGDVIMLDPGGADATRTATWFIIVSIVSNTIVMRQLNNFDSTNGTNYLTNNWQQINPGWSGNALWICTRIKQNHRLWVGDVTAGSAVITNVKHAFRFGATDDFTTGTMGMQVGDLFLHQEIERANTGGSGLKVTNPVVSIDYDANTITLTNPFNITRTNYPVVFFVKVYNP